MNNIDGLGRKTERAPSAHVAPLEAEEEESGAVPADGR